MNDEAPKSAYEIAMERLRKKDTDAGIEESHVTDEQKAQIAEVRQMATAKIAERRILHQSALMKTFDAAERLQIEEAFRRDIQRIEEGRERKIEKIRKG